MDRTISRPLPHAAIALAAISLAVPATAAASTGGAGLTSPTHKRHTTRTTHKAHSSRSQVPTTPVTGRGNRLVTATGNGVTVQARRSALLRHGLTFSGTAPGDAGKTIEIERNGHQTAWEWAPTVSTTVQPGGAFSVTWKTNHIGRFAIRAVLETNLAQPAATTESMPVTVYLPSVASWYGMFGHGTACGYKLTRHLLGVANKTLPCGENVALYYHGRTLVVPVIDRGPYVKGRRYDLTYATAKALGTLSAGVATIGAVSLPTAP
ncbi:MAG TPA: septal ring lytic transglycosylase RlpA family protein [Solirubrobacteraceae bacterium]|nr:septal ring lytic transglycosylase RlpA family protein [Solirubrobacteraceae bacterium]